MRRGLLLIAMLGLLWTPLTAQVSSPAPADPNTKTAPQSAQAGLSVAGNMRTLLAQLEQTSMAANGDVAGLRIEKWKTDSSVKRDAGSMAQSIQRNLTNALPGMIAAVRTSPDSLAASFTLYRNLDTLYDVVSTLTNMTGAMGPKQEYETLAKDAAGLDELRRQLAEQIQQLAAFKDGEVGRLMVQLRNAQAAAAAVPPTKIVVDDEEKPVKKPAVRKKKPAAPTQNQPAQQTAPPRQ